MKKLIKRKFVKTKLFNTVKTENSEKDMLMGFIKVGTDITMVDTTHNNKYISEFAFERKTVMDIDDYRIIFQSHTPEIGYMRHPSYLFRKHKLKIKKKKSNKWLLNIVQDGHSTNYILENY